MFNTDYDGVTNKIEVLDAAAQFAFASWLNVSAAGSSPLATARISTARSTRTNGRSIPTVSRMDFPRSFKAVTTVWPTGVILPRK